VIDMRTMLVVLVLAGCQAAADPAPSTAPSTLPDKIRAVRDRMHVRFDATRRMQLAIGLGDLTRAHDEAKIVADLDEPDALPEWRAYVDKIREASRQVIATKDTIAAARTSAQLGRQCAQCHVALSSKIVFPKEQAPANDPRLAVQMASHQWAAARMWEGLVAPNDDRWLLGAKTLAQAPLAIVAEADPPNGIGIGNDIGRVRLLANRALKPMSQSDRAELYGDLLATCAHCHFTIRDR
jgi:hypothetical protein